MVIGVDEAGRGPVLGPLVVAAVSFTDQGSLDEAGVKDSKMLTPSKRESIHSRFFDEAVSGIIMVPAESVDCARERMTMNRLEVLAFSSAIATVFKGVPINHPDLPDGVLSHFHGKGIGEGQVRMDAADVNQERFGREVGDQLSLLIPGGTFDIQSRHKADRDDPYVALASVIAKVSRDNEIKALERDFGVKTGSGYPSDITTRNFIARWIRENGELPPHTRRTWETARKLISENLQPTLFSFE
jgi:ribonuclease HII